MSYRNLEIWKLSKDLTIEIHNLSMQLPKTEQYEEGQQIRRSIKSVRSNIVEGYGRRRYKLDFIKFIVYAISSNDETIDHLEMLFETKSLTDKTKYEDIHNKLNILGKKLNAFLRSVQSGHDSSYLNEPESEYFTARVSDSQHPASDFKSWQTVKVTAVYENPWIKLDEHQVINPSGKPGIYGKVHFKNRAIGIIPMDEDNNTWLVGQHRYTLDQWSWEIPEGGGPLDQTPLEAAKRELQEETGLTATKWTELLTMYLSNSVSDEIGHVFVAEGLTEGTNDPEETEADLKVLKLPFATALEMVSNGEITDSLSVAGILKLARIKGL